MIAPGTAVRRRVRPGLALMEIVLGMALLMVVAVAVLACMSSGIRTARSVGLEADAPDLASTAMAEAMLEPAGPAEFGPEAFEEPYEKWTREILVEEEELTPDLPPLLRVEVVVRHAESRTVRRLVQWVTDPLVVESLAETEF